MRQRARLWLCAVAAYGLLVVAVPTVSAQGCAMCKETASFQNARAIESLQMGILWLGIPPLAVVGGIGWFTYRRWNDVSEQE